MMKLTAALLVLTSLVGCHHKPAKMTPFVEQAPPTSGAPLLQLLPPAADVVLEVDVERVRDNDVLGTVVVKAAPLVRANDAAAPLLPVDVLRDADVVVAAVYDLGGSTAATVVIVRGKAIDAAAVVKAAPDAAAELDAHTFVFAEPELRSQVVERGTSLAAPEDPAGPAVPTPSPSMADDAAFMALRARVMPVRAQGASLRLTARLSKPARIAGAGRMHVDELPAALTLWADVADDLALVAELDTDDKASAHRLANALEHGVRILDALKLDVPHDKLKIDVFDRHVRVVWTIGPKALSGWSVRVADWLEALAAPKAAPTP